MGDETNIFLWTWAKKKLLENRRNVKEERKQKEKELKGRTQWTSYEEAKRVKYLSQSRLATYYSFLFEKEKNDAYPFMLSPFSACETIFPITLSRRIEKKKKERKKTELCG